MPLLKTWAPYFQSHARRHGRDDYQQHCVKRVPSCNGDLIRAEVTAEDDSYTVVFSADGAGTTASCTCPQKSGSYCRHIWATLLAIQHGNEPFDRDTPTDQLINPRPPQARKRQPDNKAKRSNEPKWSAQLDLVRPMGLAAERTATGIPAHYQVCYAINRRHSTPNGRVIIELWQRYPTAGGFSRPARLKINDRSVLEIPDETDRKLCAMLLGAQPVASEFDDHELSVHSPMTAMFTLSLATQRPVLKRMVETNRCYANCDDLIEGLPSTLSWDGDTPWVLWLVGQLQDNELVVDLELRRDDQRLPIDEPELLISGSAGVVIYQNRVAPFDDLGASRWAAQFRDSVWSGDGTTRITVPANDIPLFLQRVYLIPQLPRLDLPPDIGRPQVHLTPVPHLNLSKTSSTDPSGLIPKNHLAAQVWFAYNHHRVNPGQPGWFVTDRADTANEARGEPANEARGEPADEARGEPANEARGEPADEQEQQDTPTPQLVHRDLPFEQQATDFLWPLGFRRSGSTTPGVANVTLPSKLMHQAVSELTSLGWIVSQDDQVIRNPQAPVLSVATGIDWFELRGSVRYQTSAGDQEVALSEILTAARTGRNTLVLNDGSQGMLPQQWLSDNGLLTAIGKLNQDHLRFKSTQAVILDSLLSRQAAINADEKFKQIRSRLHQFDGVSPTAPAKTFHGQLRPYQQEGLGWLFYLQTLAIGGILADDMGLGKTVQVLAMLDWFYNGHRHADSPVAAVVAPNQTVHRPTLIVVPRSIVFNWMDEARRFGPKLRVQAYTGTDRQALRNAFGDHDLIVTSYGLMRRDITDLAQCPFQYVVLDEAQTIKNAGSQSAKAARLLNCQHRLALTGTPVENHLGDLWSILEFLNPGMLGSNTRFAQLVRSMSQQRRLRAATPENRNPDPHDDVPDNFTPKAAGVAKIADALKPFILRRTKQQVLQDLPEKTEQTIVCQMASRQRSMYDQLLRHYRGSLLSRRAIGSTGAIPADKTMMVLEALLRLRQAACHPGLIDPARADEPSAKLDVLMDRIHDLIEEGHKALIFSQFTSMLALVRKQLDTRGIVYEYLDGKTRNRSEPIERFQSDPHCPLFLISLKAGGLGLNLTAAGYVFILDPWWNPAVEAQAIDRAHRIGQTRHVFAYRLICQDTVEQRIAQLQQRKRRLAEAIIDGQENVLRSLSRDDLQYLLT